MTKRSCAVSIACILGVSLVSSAAIPFSAHAQSADLVLCDRIAADPFDPDKPADVKGTAEIAPSDIPTAIKFCKTAAASSRRALYELGRAYAANRQMPEAIGALYGVGKSPPIQPSGEGMVDEGGPGIFRAKASRIVR